MSNLKRFASIMLLMIFIVASAISTGCTKYANSDQLNALDQQKAAAESAEKAVSDCEDESAALAREVSSKEKELADVKAEKEKVKERLSQM
ncbi:MAG: hypothetical protein V3U73_00210 [bacterium]|jgi:septal ring factor EnvC (AmiA/AmiB activator)